MLIYVILIFAILFVFATVKNKNRALLVSFILITLVAAMRKYTVGVDTAQFYNMFDLIGQDQTWNYTNFRFEAGFYYLCKILELITSNAQILIILTSIFINFSVYKFINKNSPDLLLSTILYILMLYFFSNMNIMRQAIALAILLFGFEYLKEKKYIKYIFVILFASLFHTVSFAGLLLLIFDILPAKRTVYIFEIIIAIITFVFYKQFFNILSMGFGYSGYANSEFGVSNYFGSVLAALEIFFVISFLYLTSCRKGENNSSRDMKLLTIATILHIWFSFLIIRMNIFNRISGLYGIYNIILIPKLLDNSKKLNNDNYKISKTICILIYIISFTIISIFRPEWHGAIPYKFFWK